MNATFRIWPRFVEVISVHHICDCCGNPLEGSKVVIQDLEFCCEDCRRCWIKDCEDEQGAEE